MPRKKTNPDITNAGKSAHHVPVSNNERKAAAADVRRLAQGNQARQGSSRVDRLPILRLVILHRQGVTSQKGEEEDYPYKVDDLFARSQYEDRFDRAYIWGLSFLDELDLLEKEER